MGGLAQGAPVVCAPVFNAAESAAAVRRHAVTHTYANNEALVGMMEAASPGDFASVRLFGFASFTPALDRMLDLARETGVPRPACTDPANWWRWLPASRAIQPRATYPYATSLAAR